MAQLKKSRHTFKLIIITGVGILVLFCIATVIWDRTCPIKPDKDFLAHILTRPSYYPYQSQACSTGGDYFAGMSDFLLSLSPKVYCNLVDKDIFGSEKYCLTRTKDSGTPCTDSSQCEYACIIEYRDGRETNIYASDITDSVVGYCSKNYDQCLSSWRVTNGVASKYDIACENWW